MNPIVVVKNIKPDDHQLNECLTEWFQDIQYRIADWFKPLSSYYPFDMVLFVGVSATYRINETGRARVIAVPLHTASMWTPAGKRYVGRLIREGVADLEIRIDRDTRKIISEELIPF